MNLDSFGSRSGLDVAGRTFVIHRLAALEARFPAVAKLPIPIRILLENLLRSEDGRSVSAEDIESVARWQAKAAPAAGRRRIRMISRWSC
jgi:aconitate hydratase